MNHTSCHGRTKTMSKRNIIHGEPNWLDSCHLEYRPLSYRQYVDDVMMYSYFSNPLIT